MQGRYGLRLRTIPTSRVWMAFGSQARPRMMTVDEAVARAKAEVERHLDGARYRTRRMLQQQGATKAEVDDALAWMEREVQKALREQLEQLRQELTAFLRLH